MSPLGGGTGIEIAGGTRQFKRSDTGGQALHIRRNVGESNLQQFAGESSKTEAVEKSFVQACLLIGSLSPSRQHDGDLDGDSDLQGLPLLEG